MVDRLTASRRSRQATHFGVWLGLIFVVALASIVISWFLGSRPHLGSLKTYVVVEGDPTLVWAANTSQNSSVLITIPAALQIEAVHGYGQYAIDSLWRLSRLDHDPTLVALSLQDTLGLPLVNYLSGTAKVKAGTPLTLLKTYFSLMQIPKFLTGGLRTNLKLTQFLSLVTQARILTADKVQIINLAGSSALTIQKLPDGTQVELLDPDSLSLLLGHSFEEETIRQEALSVAVYNTTDFSNLGERLAKILDNIGVLVVSVGNDSPEKPQCLITTAPAYAQKTTTLLLKELFKCQLSLTGDLGRSNLELRLGTNNKEQLLRKLP